MLVLSEFAGAAQELRDAVLVNPFDVDGMRVHLEEALAMPQQERARRMRLLRGALKENDVFHWAERFLEALTG